MSAMLGIFWIWPGEALILLGLLMAVAWTIKATRRHHRCQWQQRMEQGLCLHCGYDLRASPTRCPECGRPVDPFSPGFRH